MDGIIVFWYFANGPLASVVWLKGLIIDMAAFLKMLEEEWHAISSAPFSLFTAVFLVGLVIWWFVNLLKRSEIAGKDATIISQEKHIAFYDDKLKDSRQELDDSRRDLRQLQVDIKLLAKAHPRDSLAEQQLLAASAMASKVGSSLEGLASTLDSATEIWWVTSKDKEDE